MTKNTKKPVILTIIRIAGFFSKSFSEKFFFILDNCSVKKICIRMNKAGKDLFRKIYHGRPSPVDVKEDGNWYWFYFDCSIAQASLYFRKFEQDTIEIVEPKELKEDLALFFQKAVIPLCLNMQK